MLSVRDSLPTAVRRPMLVLAPPAAIAVVVLGLLVHGRSTPSAFDRWALDASGGPIPYPSQQRLLAQVVDLAGEPVGAGLLVTGLIAFCLVLGHQRSALLAIFGPSLSVAVTTVLKPVAGRTINGPHLSFPSGHTAIVTAVALVFAFVVVDRLGMGPRAGTAVVLYTAATAGGIEAWAQYGMVVHYPSDTLGGFCVALAVVPPAGWVVDRVTRGGGTPV